MPYSTTVFRTRINSGTIQFNLAFNVQTQTQSLQLLMSTRTSLHTKFVSMLMSVFLYPMNIKTAEPIEPILCGTDTSETLWMIKFSF